MSLHHDGGSLLHDAQAMPSHLLASVADERAGITEADRAAVELAELAAQALEGQLELPALAHTDAHLDELCERLAWWAVTRRIWGGPRGPKAQLGRLVKRTRPMRATEPDAMCAAELQALWIAMVAQPAESLDRIVFELHYLHRISNVKAAAAALDIGRQHWYTVLRQFRRRIYVASKGIMVANEQARRAIDA